MFNGTFYQYDNKFDRIFCQYDVVQQKLSIVCKMYFDRSTCQWNKLIGKV